jgi:hypothetical protein
MVQREQGVSPSHFRCLPRHARHAAGTDGGAAGCCDARPSVVADGATVEDKVAVPGLSLETVGEPLLEAADDSGASGEKGSMSAINPTQSGADSDGRREAGFCGRRAVAQLIGGMSNKPVAERLDLDELPQSQRKKQASRCASRRLSWFGHLHLAPAAVEGSGAASRQHLRSQSRSWDL